MKIYINKLNITLLPDLQTYLAQYNNLLKTYQYIELITNEGIYHIDNSHIKCLYPVDGPVKLYEHYYKEYTMIVDSSSCKRVNVHSIHGDKHFQQKVTKHVYQTNLPSLHFVIETYHETSHDDKTCTNGKDCYFESNEMLDMNELFVKQAIIEFLLLLT